MQILLPDLPEGDEDEDEGMDSGTGDGGEEREVARMRLRRGETITYLYR